MEKPPVLSEEEIEKWCSEHKAGKGGICYVANSCEICKRRIQRDKDVEWYGDMILQVTERSIRAGETALNKVFKVQQKAIRQARQDTAQEIFGAIERESETPFNSYYDIKIIKPRYQSLKSKFLIPPNPVGSADL